MSKAQHEPATLYKWRAKNTGLGMYSPFMKRMKKYGDENRRLKKDVRRRNV